MCYYLHTCATCLHLAYFNLQHGLFGKPHGISAALFVQAVRLMPVPLHESCPNLRMLPLLAYLDHDVSRLNPQDFLPHLATILKDLKHLEEISLYSNCWKLLLQEEFGLRHFRQKLLHVKVFNIWTEPSEILIDSQSDNGIIFREYLEKDNSTFVCDNPKCLQN